MVTLLPSRSSLSSFHISIIGVRDPSPIDAVSPGMAGIAISGNGLLIFDKRKTSSVDFSLGSGGVITPHNAEETTSEKVQDDIIGSIEQSFLMVIGNNNQKHIFYWSRKTSVCQDIQ